MNSLKVMAICGSVRASSANLFLLQLLHRILGDRAIFSIHTSLDTLPHFNPDLDKDLPPSEVTDFRKEVEAADGIIICSPEYVFSMPAVLKNSLEWLVSTTVLEHKPMAVITAGASASSALESIVKVTGTLGAEHIPQTQMAIAGARGKINADGVILDEQLVKDLQKLCDDFLSQINARYHG